MNERSEFTCRLSSLRGRRPLAATPAGGARERSEYARDARERALKLSGWLRSLYGRRLLPEREEAA